MGMGKARYSEEADNPEKSCRAKGSYLRVHFKNTYEVAMSIKGMNLRKAERYLNDVIDKKQAIAFRVFNGGPGRLLKVKMLRLLEVKLDGHKRVVDLFWIS